MKKKLLSILLVVATFSDVFAQNHYPNLAPFPELSPTMVPHKGLEIIQQNKLSTGVFYNWFTIPPLLRHSQLTNLLQVTYGIGKNNRLNIVGSVSFDHIQTALQTESVLGIFSKGVANQSYVDRKSSSFGLHARFMPFKKLPSLTFQAGFLIPSKQGIYQKSLAVGQLRLNYKHNFKQNFGFFASVGSDVYFPKKGNRIDATFNLGLHPFYCLPNKRTQLNGSLQQAYSISPSGFSRTQFSSGLGISHYITPKTNLYLNGSVPFGRLNAQPKTRWEVSLGLRYRI